GFRKALRQLDTPCRVARRSFGMRHAKYASRSDTFKRRSVFGKKKVKSFELTSQRSLRACMSAGFLDLRTPCHSPRLSSWCCGFGVFLFTYPPAAEGVAVER